MNPYRQPPQIKASSDWRSFSSRWRKRKRLFLIWLGNNFWREEKCPWCPRRGCTWAQQFFCQLRKENENDSK